MSGAGQNDAFCIGPPHYGVHLHSLPFCGPELLPPRTHPRPTPAASFFFSAAGQFDSSALCYSLHHFYLGSADTYLLGVEGTLTVVLLMSVGN